MHRWVFSVLLVGTLALLAGCAGRVVPQANPQCVRQAACDDWLQLRSELEPLLRGNQADVPTGQGTESSPHQAYLRLKSAFYSDPQFNCRQPLTARYLAVVWQLGDEAGRCTRPVPFRVRGLTSLDSVRWIDPSRVQAVHLLFMGQSGQSFSRFGHIAVRLIVCGPQRKRVGPECEEDIQEHIVLGFSASIADPEISLWRGVVGGYPIGLFASDFHDVYQQYTIDEFRSVASVPMTLSDEEQSLLIQGLAQTHWNYSTDYRFFTHNCASELQWLLNMASYASGAGAQPLGTQSRVRPDKLFADAMAHPRFRGSVLDDLKLAEHQGYYFPSAEPYLQYAYDVLVPWLQGRDAQANAGAQAWYSAGASYRAVQLQGLPTPPAEGAKKALDAFLVLETWSARRLQRALINALFSEHREELLQASRAVPGDSGRENDNAEALRRCLSSLLLPEAMSTAGEGIPGSTSALLQSACEADNKQLAQSFKGLLEQLLSDKALGSQYQSAMAEIRQIGKNIETAQRQRAGLALSQRR